MIGSLSHLRDFLHPYFKLNTMKSNKINFEGEDGIQLSAYLDFPLGNRPKHFAVFAHCFTCNKNFHAVTNISRGLTQEGIAVLRFDFTGLGASEGEFEDTNFTSNIQDLLHACEYLSQHYKAPDILIGHSLGGAAVLHAAAQLPSINAIVTIGAPADPEHVTHLIDQQKEDILTEGSAEVSIGGRPFRIKKQFLNDLENKSIEQINKDLRGKSILVFHSPQDDVVGIENARKIYESLHHPKSFISLDGANHLLTNKGDAQYVGQLIEAWAHRYINDNEKSHFKTKNQVAARIDHEKFSTEMIAGKHRFLADEPESVGGDDLGPSPYDLLAASLASCTAMTLRMYANHKKIPLKEVEVHVDHSKEHLTDSESSDSKSKIDVFKRYIYLEGDLDPSQKERLIEIANKCPVHRSLHNDINIETSLKEA